LFYLHLLEANKIIICRNESTINDGCILFLFDENMHKLLKGSN